MHPGATRQHQHKDATSRNQKALHQFSPYLLLIHQRLPPSGDANPKAEKGPLTIPATLPQIEGTGKCG
jgi:hypothetical protein